MCLAVPGLVERWVNQEPVTASAVIRFGGVTRECSMACTPDADVGDYVIVHAGIAIAIVDEAAALQTLRDLEEAGLNDRLEGDMESTQ